jgi:anti-sigma factor RsiW
MNHPTDDELIEQFSGDADPVGRARLEAHLRECDECRREWAGLSAALTIVDAAVPEPPDGFERVMWARVSQAIADAPQRRMLWSWRQLLPAGSLMAAVIAGILVSHVRETTPAAVPPPVATAADAARADLKQNERVLFTALDEHFQQAEALLVEVRNAPDRDSLAVERVTADDLVAAGRLYRQTAEYTGHDGLVRMLDDLEPVLVEVARSPVRLDQQDRDWLRTRIDDDNLLFKVRAVTSDIRERATRGNW